MQYLITKLQYPRDITSFLDCVFEIYEIRGRVGSQNGINFSIRTNEHAEYGEHNISIEIANGNILAGNLPKKNQKIAVEWVLKNKDKLLNDWKDIAISATSSTTMSRLDFKD